MIKSLIISFCLTLVCLQSNSQSLSGQWEGEFIQNSTIRLPIFLELFMNADSTYSAISYSYGNNKGKDTIVACNVKVEVRKKSIYMEEVEVIYPKDYAPIGLQKMFLKISDKNKKIALQGRWEDVNIPDSGGSIRFWKKK